MTPIAIVEAFCAAWDRLDWDTIHGLLADDILYHNIPMAPSHGLAEFKAGFAAFPITEAAFEILHIAANGNLVMTERIDRFLLAGKPASLSSSASWGFSRSATAGSPYGATISTWPNLPARCRASPTTP